ncbi:hypothetical protein D918_04107 [Trichuris suis]|nr:hypothetical protein D918_04107 [Trichuris suis]
MLLYCLLDVSCELQWACNHLKVEWLILTKYFEEVLLPARREGRLLITGQEFVLRRDINGLIVITLEEKEARSNSSRLPGRLVTLQKKYDLFFYLYCRGQLKEYVLVAFDVSPCLVISEA